MQAIPQGPALVLAVQPLESWRELWVISRNGGKLDDRCAPAWAGQSGGGLRRFCGLRAGNAGGCSSRGKSRRARRFRRSFEELRLDDLALVRQASSPELLRDFGRWQDVAWRKDTLALH